MKSSILLSSIGRLCCLVMAFVTFSCNNRERETSVFDKLLSAPPYSVLTDSIHNFPQRDELYFHRAVLLNKNNLPEPALVDFRKAWSLDKQERYALGVATILLDTKPDSAVKFIQAALNVLPKSIFLQLTLARAYNAQEKTTEALAATDRLLETEPNQVNALILKSELLEKKDDRPAMIAVLEKAHLLLPQSLEISNKLAYQYAENKDPKAIALSDTLIKVDSLQLHAEPYYIKGNYYSNTGDKAKAIEQFDETIRHDHRFLNAYIEKGKILLDQKKTTDALKTFTLANTINPAFADAWYWMGKSQLAMGKQEEAKSNFEKAYELDKSFTEAKEAAEAIK